MRLDRLIPRRARQDTPDAPPWPSLGGRGVRIGLPLALIAGLVGVTVLAAGGEVPLPGEPDPAVADLVPYDGRSPREPAADEQRVIVRLPRPALGELETRPSAARQRAYVASLEEEAASLRSALQARGVELRDVVGFQRVLNGFAATVDVEDLADLSSLGVRAQPVRRTFPAVSEPVPVAGRPPRRPPVTGERVALLAAGVRGPGLDPGYDAVDGDRDASPRPALRRREASGTALAGVLAGAGARVVPVRVASLRPGAAGVEEAGTSDALIAGLEWVVDPDRDGATGDALPVAVAGVHAPYAGFTDAPEARAARAAAGLGTLLVAPAGHEGAGGTVGSPGAARAALTVGALQARGAVPRTDLTVGTTEAPGAAVLAGTPPRGLRTAGPVEADDPEAYLRPGAPRLQNRAAVVRAGANPSAQVAAAAAAGARLVVLADPGPGPLPAPAAGRAPVAVVGLTGESARAVLELEPGVPVRAGRVRPGDGGAVRAMSPFSSRGPALGGSRKPDLAAAGAARTSTDGRRGAVVGGTGVAAALAGAHAARLAAARPDATPAELAGALRAAAAPLDAPAQAAGTGTVRPPALRTTGSALRVAPAPAMALPAPGPVPVGPLALTREDGRVTGVRFTVGAFTRGDARRGGTRLRAAGRLELVLVAPGGKVVRRLTPPGGARDLLPAEYAYTLPADARDALPDGPLRFRAVARGPRGGAATRRTSPPFAG